MASYWKCYSLAVVTVVAVLSIAPQMTGLSTSAETHQQLSSVSSTLAQVVQTPGGQRTPPRQRIEDNVTVENLTETLVAHHPAEDANEQLDKALAEKKESDIKLQKAKDSLYAARVLAQEKSQMFAKLESKRLLKIYDVNSLSQPVGRWSKVPLDARMSNSDYSIKLNEQYNKMVIGGNSSIPYIQLLLTFVNTAQDLRR